MGMGTALAEWVGWADWVICGSLERTSHYSLYTQLAVWRHTPMQIHHRPHPIPYTYQRGVLVSGVRRMNKVNQRRARLVLGWVTVFGRAYHLNM